MKYVASQQVYSAVDLIFASFIFKVFRVAPYRDEAMGKFWRGEQPNFRTISLASYQ